MRVVLVLIGLLAASCGSHAKTPPHPTPTPSVAAQPSAPAPAFKYPQAPRGSVVETQHGVAVPDPYRWLEDAQSPQTRAWIDAENGLTMPYLQAIPAREVLKQRLTALWDYERFDLPRRKGGRYFYSYNPGLKNQPSWYWLASLDAEPKLLLDPNLLAQDGTVALKAVLPSRDGKLVAYGAARAGSDWVDWKVRRVDTGEDTSDEIRWNKFSQIAWAHDGKGFYYSRYDEPQPGTALEQSNYYNKLYFHVLGQTQASDRLLYERPQDKEWSFEPIVSDDGRYLIVSVSKGTDNENAVLVQDLKRPGGKLEELLMTFDAEYSFIGNRGSTLWFKTDLRAPRGRVVSLSLSDAKRTLQEVIPERPETLRQVERIGGRFVGNYLKDAHAELHVFSGIGKWERAIDLPALGTVWLESGDDDSSEVFWSFESYSRPPTIYRDDVVRGKPSVFRGPQLSFDPTAYETQQVFYKSKDGTAVPMFLVRKADTVLSQDTPCLLFGYGGFGLSLTPSFSPQNLAWMELGGLYAVPNLRGGGEYGESWHDAGKKHNKQNVFDDFIAAAEYLIEQKLTSASKLAIHGRSNGGLLMGAMLTQRPDLFAAVLPGVGVMDMLRFHKFTIGWAWVDDYGSPDDAADFAALYAYSPLHNLKPRSYPATLITTADHDDRVVPAHSFKFAAALQAAQTGSAPILIRIDVKAGHGAGKPTSKRIEEVADQWAFLTKILGMTVPAP
jgi:prolyl oligopeptidase